MSGQFVQADPGLCIACGTCMANCMNKHSVEGDYPKARLNVVTTLMVSAPIACHHCADAACVNACPEGALYYDEDRVGIKQERCIGCRNCVQACPFGAVEVVPTEKTETLGGLTVEGTKKSFLIKCDLCYDRPNGPACVEACPTKALRLVDKVEIEADTVMKRRAELNNTAPVADAGIFELVRCFAELNDDARSSLVARASELADKDDVGSGAIDLIRQQGKDAFPVSANINYLINKFAKLADDGRQQVVEFARELSGIVSKEG